MRIALLADIHGNPVALDAVLRDIQAQGGVEALWFNGDYVALGHAPITVLERIAALPGAVFTRGNTDRLTVSDDLIEEVLTGLREHPEMAPRLLSILVNFNWTRGYITAGGWLNWLAGLPLDHRAVLPDGTRVLVVHAAPGRDDGPGITLATSDAELAALVDGCGADLVVVSHTHWPFDRTVEGVGVRVINTGSVSNPPARDLRASYVLLEADATGYRLDFRRVDYDRQTVIDAVRRVRHPGAGHFLAHLEGRFIPPWAEELGEEW